MIALGNQLGLSTALIRRVGMAGLLHDIGKMAIPGADSQQAWPVEH